MKHILFFALISVFALTGYSQSTPVKTIENLKSAIRGETTASAKYAAFAKKAKEEGKNSIATLFAAASKSESIHAANHKSALEASGKKMEAFTPKFEVKTTAENLKAAIDGETYEVETMYPQFISEANTEKADNAASSFNWAFGAEKKHQKFYMNALSSLKSNSENTLPVEYAVCPVCGNTFQKGAVDQNCPFCQTSSVAFIHI
jgi:rubrerythrin